MTFIYNIRYYQQRISSVDSNLKRPFLHSSKHHRRRPCRLAAFRSSDLIPHCPALPWRPGVFIGTLSGPQAKA